MAHAAAPAPLQDKTRLLAARPAQEGWLLKDEQPTFLFKRGALKLL